MLELFSRAQWGQAYDYLASGEPPMMLRLLAINTIFFILFIIRRAKGLSPMRDSTMLQVQGLLILANCLILFQRDIQNFLSRFI